jgi:hypothetical protein
MPYCEFNTKKKQTWNVPSSEFYTPCKNTKLSIHDALFEKVEMSGNFTMGRLPNKSCDSIKSCQIKHKESIKLNGMNKGDVSSVKTKFGVCNFHTHPYNCYNAMGTKSKRDMTIWGWPSGEDMRESILFALHGNLIHLVFTLEGIYSIEVNPHLINLLETDDKAHRGMILAVIEEYFRCTHVYRNVVYNEAHGVVIPNDWLKFAKQFTLKNLITSHNKCTANLPCNGIPDGKRNTIDLHEFKHELPHYHLTEQYKLSEKKNKKALEDFIENYETISKRYQAKHDDWNPGQWFRIKFSENTIDGKLVTAYMKEKSVQEIKSTWDTIASSSRERLQFNKSKHIKFTTYAIQSNGSCVFNDEKQKRSAQSFGRNFFKR